eukprot:839442-Prymnesium_polylepis.1
MNINTARAQPLRPGSLRGAKPVSGHRPSIPLLSQRQRCRHPHVAQAFARTTGEALDRRVADRLHDARPKLIAG